MKYLFRILPERLFILVIGRPESGARAATNSVTFCNDIGRLTSLIDVKGSVNDRNAFIVRKNAGSCSFNLFIVFGELCGLFNIGRAG